MATRSSDVSNATKTPNIKPIDVLTVGEAMALFIANTPGPLPDVVQFSRTIAGAELNVAIGLIRLGWRVGYISRVGKDMLGEYLLSAMDGEGVDLRYVQVDDQHPTGLMFKSREESGEDPKTQYFRKGSAASHMGPGDLPKNAFNGVRLMHLTGISVALSDSMRELVQHMMRSARLAGVHISFDPNLRPKLWSSEQVMVNTLNAFAVQADLVMPGLTEGRLLTGYSTPPDIASYYLDHGTKQVVIKLGPSGAYVASQMERSVVNGFQVPHVVDTVGAGDGFAVGVISALMHGHSLQAAALRGNAIGSRVVQYKGDSEGLPNPQELEIAMTAPRTGTGGVAENPSRFAH
jgi:sugar/nucleoside kinase (ribokinase family)